MSVDVCDWDIEMNQNEKFRKLKERFVFSPGDRARMEVMLLHVLSYRAGHVGKQGWFWRKGGRPEDLQVALLIPSSGRLTYSY